MTCYQTELAAQLLELSKRSLAPVGQRSQGSLAAAAAAAAGGVVQAQPPQACPGPCPVP